MAKATGGTQNAAGTLLGVNQASRTRVSTNSSHLGFKGVEDLGNGLKAVFQFENGINVDNSAAGTLNSRDTFVGLAGGFGTVIMGNLSTPYRSALAGLELTPGATGAPSAMMNGMGKALTTVRNNANLQSGAAGANSVVDGLTTTATRVSNAIAYVTPTFSGFTGVVAYSAGITGAEAKTATPIVAGGVSTNNTAWTGSLSYNQGPIKVVYAFQRIADVGAIFGINGLTNAAVGNASDGTSKVNSQLLGGSYQLGDTTLVAVWDQNTAKAGSYGAAANGAGEVTQAKINSWALGAKHVIGKNEFAAEYVRTGNAKITSRLNDVNGDHGAKSYSLRYGYNMSKRTQAYAFFSQTSNNQLGSYDFTTSGVGITGAGSNPQSYGAGLRHSF